MARCGNKLLCQWSWWVWDQACQEAFTKLKLQLASAEVLAHYDMKLPVKLDCDALAYGLGAVLSHKFPDGSERPIAYASRTSREKLCPNRKGGFGSGVWNQEIPQVPLQEAIYLSN